MDPARIDAVLGDMTPEEVADALWLIDVCELWDMPREEADEWRRRIEARQAFLELGADGGPVS